MRKTQSEQLNILLQALQFFVAGLQQGNRNAVPITRIFRYVNGNELETRWGSVLDIFSEIVCPGYQPPCCEYAGTQVRRKLVDIGSSTNQLDLAQLPEEANSLNICLFAFDFRGDVQPTYRGTGHLDELLCGSSGVRLRCAVRTMRNPNSDPDSSDGSDSLNPCGDSWLCGKADDRAQAKGNMEESQTPSDSDQRENRPVREFEGLSCHRRLVVRRCRNRIIVKEEFQLSVGGARGLR